MISKGPSIANNYRRQMQMHPSARVAFRAYLEGIIFEHNDCVLLPAYIGWSAREGSGVFDPVTGLGLNYAFYPLDESLNIDLVGLRKAFEENKVKVLVIIHYFGLVDPRYAECIAMAREFGVEILEDEAHALFTDLVGGLTGRSGDASIFSLHKMLPLVSGGVLCLNANSAQDVTNSSEVRFPVFYDFARISAKRVQNYFTVVDLLKGKSGKITVLKPKLEMGEIPQSLPVLIGSVSRDVLYERMNEAGFGVVSLYHTMISEISREDFPRSFSVADRILNLPIHQDVESFQLENMVETLFSTIDFLEQERR